MIRNSFFIN